MKKTINTKLFITLCIAALLIGTLQHFVYDFFNKPFILGLFAPVNESVWEHLKLVIVPITLFDIVYTLIYKRSNYKLNSFWYYSSLGMLISMFTITLIHYFAKLIFKNTNPIFDILLYISSIIIAFIYIYYNMKKQYNNVSTINKNKVGIIIITIIYLLFIIFTIYPPKLNIFKDPITNTYGIFSL